MTFPPGMPTRPSYLSLLFLLLGLVTLHHMSCSIFAFSIENSPAMVTKTSPIGVPTGVAVEQRCQNEEQQQLGTPQVTPKTIYGIRHGKSIANEFMEKPGNRWGEATFCDDISLVDARLSSSGIEQTKLLAQQLSKDSCENQWLNDLELILISPLTRCIQTWIYAVLPAILKTYGADRMPPVLVLPILRERVYTASDNGRSLLELSQEFDNNFIDWDKSIEMHTNGSVEPGNNSSDIWWYHHPESSRVDNNKPYINHDEWRPYGDGQYYAVPGEPLNAFQERMAQFKEFLQQRPEKSILLITHWGVLRNFTGEEIDNCEVVQMTLPLPNNPT